MPRQDSADSEKFRELYFSVEEEQERVRAVAYSMWNDVFDTLRPEMSFEQFVEVAVVYTAWMHTTKYDPEAGGWDTQHDHSRCMVKRARDICWVAHPPMIVLTDKYDGVDPSSPFGEQLRYVKKQVMASQELSTIVGKTHLTQQQIDLDLIQTMLLGKQRIND